MQLCSVEEASPSDQLVSEAVSIAVNSLYITDYIFMCWESISLDTTYKERARVAQCNLRSFPPVIK